MIEERAIVANNHDVRLLTSSGARRSRWLVLWPGLGATAEEFQRLLREGAENDWGVAAVDPPGHGRSPAWEQWDDSSPLAIWDGVYAALGQPTTLVVGGHSAGAYFAVMWAVHRTNCAGLVLLEGGYQDPIPVGRDMAELYRQNAAYLESRRYSSWSRYWQAERSAAVHWDADAEAMLTAQMVESQGVVQPRLTVKTANQVMQVLARYSVDRLPLMAVPALAAVATCPQDIHEHRIQGVAALRRRVPSLETVYISGAGHDLLIDNPSAVSHAVWSFLSPIAS